jgi:hypothetical protein
MVVGGTHVSVAEGTAKGEASRDQQDADPLRRPCVAPDPS